MEAVNISYVENTYVRPQALTELKPADFNLFSLAAKYHIFVTVASKATEAILFLWSMFV